jgi:MoaA/NifB/PqqE/SkfB family radical SAM enzyme
MNDYSQDNLERAQDQKPRHHLGWQITGKCNRCCRYCLRRRTDKPTFELGEEDCARIIESYLDFVVNNGMVASIMFSGGNPMLRPDLPSLLRKTLQAREQGIVDHTSILANPETLDTKAVANIAECKVDLVFISLDGRKENSDRMRGPGSFDAGVAAIKNLSEAGVNVNVKYTLTTPKNEVCWTCLVREHCRGDNRYCWKLQRSV